MKKLLASILVSSVVMSALAGCATVNETTETPVYSSSASVNVYADWLTNRLADDGITHDGEIIVGNADDAESYGIDMTDIRGDGYVIRRAEGTDGTLIFGKTDLAVDTAVRYYANYCDKSGPLNVVEGEGYRVSSITIAGVDLSEYVIVCPADADECQKFAASELKRFLGDACGVYPEIVTESDGFAITLICDESGETYGDEGFNVKCHDKGLTITGGRYRGCMYGVYDLLEQYIGYRFYYGNPDYAANGTEDSSVYLYEADEVVIGADVDYTEEPSIRVRDTYGLPFKASPALKYNGEKFRVSGNKYGFGYGDVLKACHGYGTFITDADLERLGYTAGYKYNINPCFTDEALNNVLIENILADCKNRVNSGQVIGKDFTTVDIAQLDMNSFCVCDNCVSVYGRTGSKAGAIVNLANKVAEVLDEEYPGLTVAILAYYGTDKPPRNVTIHEDVYVSYCFYVSEGGRLICGNHSIDGTECDANSFFAKQFENWTKLTDNLYVWYYPMTSYFKGYSSTYTFNIYNDIKYLAENNTYGIFALGDPAPETGMFAGWYMQQRMMWDASITEEEYHKMLKEYLWLAYGDGYESIYEFISLMETAADMKDCFCGFHSFFDEKMDMDYIEKNLDYIFALRENAVRFARTTAEEELCDKLFATAYYYEIAVKHDDMWQNGDDATRKEYKAKVDYFLENYGWLRLNDDGPISSAVTDSKYETPPFEWVRDSRAD